MNHKAAVLRVMITGAALFLTVGGDGLAAERNASAEVEQLDIAKVDRAKALLERAVIHYRKRGDKAMADFAESGRFRDGELYIYAMSMDGKFLASGGTSSVLVGRNVAEMKDSAGKPFFREMLAGAREKEAGHIEYRWMNRAENREERKLTFYRRVGDRLLAVGFYIPRGTASMASVLLDDAVAALQRDAKQALMEFGDLNGRFVQDDLYVFVVGWDDLRMKAHGSMPHLVGTDGYKLADANGRSIIVEMRQKLQNSDRAEIDYTWRNPVTRQIESKRTFVRKLNNYIVGVGYYPR